MLNMESKAGDDGRQGYEGPRNRVDGETKRADRWTQDGGEFSAFSSSVNVLSSAAVLCPASWEFHLLHTRLKFSLNDSREGHLCKWGWGVSSIWRFKELEVCTKEKKRFIENEGIRELVFGGLVIYFISNTFQALFWTQDIKNGEQGRQIFTTLGLTALILINM